MADKDDPKAVKIEAAEEKKDDDKKKAAKKRKKGDEEKAELSEEDQKKKEELELLVKRAQDPDEGVMNLALQTMVTELKGATSTMTSVPKPLKFLRPHYPALKEHYEKLKSSEKKQFFADVLSILATTMQKEGARESLKYRLEGTKDWVKEWGHEYIRNLTGEITAEYQERTAAKGEEASLDDLNKLVDEIAPFLMSHNAECDATDLLCEVEKVDKVLEMCENESHAKVGAYLTGIANYAASQAEKIRLIKVAYELYKKNGSYHDCVRLALKLNDSEMVTEIFKACEGDRGYQKQLAFLLARQKSHHDFEDDDELRQIASNELLTQHFLVLAKDLDVVEPKLPEDIFKSHLEEKRGAAVLDSAKQNLASTFVNAFVNAGFCKDKLMTVEGAGWLYKNKEHGMMSATASLGALLLWDVDDGLTQIDKFQYSTDEYVKAGALLAFGLVTAGVKNECDPAWALLAEQLESPQMLLKLGAIVGLGHAYAGSRREDLLENLTPTIVDTSCSVEVSAMAAVSLGMIFVSSCNEEVAQAIIQTLLERQAVDGALDGTWAHFFSVGLGLLFLGQQDQVEATLAAIDAVSHPMAKTAKLTVEGMAFAGSGDVLKQQKTLGVCAEHLENESEAFHQSVAVLNLALVGMSEEIGNEMCYRALDHILQYGDLPAKRAVPLCMALLSLSNPKVLVIDNLSKLSHDADADVAMGAILAMGLMGAGTNNARLAGLLRQLAAFYSKDANALFIVRIAQGMLYMGKGLLSINPMHSDRYLVDPVALGSLMVFFHSALHMRNTVLGKSHYLLYSLVPAMHPRFLYTMDEDLKTLNVSVRVGQAVDTTGQPGKPKKITGFQTRTTPVLLQFNDRAEIATDEYITVGPCTMEGFVILKKNPNFDPNLHIKD